MMSVAVNGQELPGFEMLWILLTSSSGLAGVIVSIISLRGSASKKAIDDKIDGAILRFERTLDAKLDATFVNARNLDLQLQVFQAKIRGMNHRLSRNSTNLSIIQRALLNKGWKLELSPGDEIDEEEDLTI